MSEFQEPLDAKLGFLPGQDMVILGDPEAGRNLDLRSHLSKNGSSVQSVTLSAPSRGVLDLS